VVVAVARVPRAGESGASGPGRAAAAVGTFAFRSMRILLKVLYWLAVLAVSLALVIGLILWFESQDESEIQGSGLHALTSV
jgi:cytochrome b subunit of formate dehydrogenase